MITLAKALLVLAAMPEASQQAIGQRLALAVPATANALEMTIEAVYALPADKAMSAIVQTLTAVYRGANLDELLEQVAAALREVKWR